MRSNCQTWVAIAKRLNSARKKAGVRYKDLARETGIPVGTLSGYMSGYTSPTPERMQAIASVIGVTADFLMGRESTVS